MKRLIFLTVFFILALNSRGQENKFLSLTSIDWCIDSVDSMIEIVSVSLPIYTVCDTMSMFLTDKISPCFKTSNNVFNSFELTPDDYKNGYNLSLNINFPIDKRGEVNGVCFINKIPIFLKGFSGVEPSFLSQTSDSLIVSRKMNKVESPTCINYETVYNEELIHFKNEDLRFRIESCSLSKEEKVKKKKRFFSLFEK